MSTPTAPDNEFALFRIIGNSLPPRHGADEMLGHLRFTLAHEPPLAGCSKHWVLNRIADAEVEAECIRLVEGAGHGVLRLPFDLQAYAERFVDVSDMPPQLDRIDPRQNDGAFAASTYALEWKLRHKSRYAIALNEARNRALDAGRALARWVLPWDGACFVTVEAWQQLRAAVAQHPDALHLVVPLVRVTDNRSLLAPGFVPQAHTEPQLGFRQDSCVRFDETLRYGNLNKAALLQRLGVPGPWAQWRPAPWDAVDASPSPERDRFVQAGWVARLASGGDPQLETQDRLRWRARFLAVDQLCRRLDERVVAQHNTPGRLLCFDDAVLRHAAAQRPEAVGWVVRGAQAARLRPAPSVRDKTGCAASGDVADYLSFAPYYHPAGDASAGVQFLDGVRSAASTPGTEAARGNDRAALESLVHDACCCALAGHITGDKAFSQHAAHLLRTWFIDPPTRMNPHMRFAQVLPGVPGEGRPWGLVDFRGFWPLLDAITLTRRAGALDEAAFMALQAWCGAFLDDVRARGIGRLPNNIAVWHDLVVSALAAFTGRHGLAAEVLADLPLRFADQLAPFAVPQAELRRTRPLHYGVFLAQALSGAALLGRRLGIDLWRYAASQRRSLAMLLRFLALNRNLLRHEADDAVLDDRLAALCRLVPADAVDAGALNEGLVLVGKLASRTGLHTSGDTGWAFVELFGAPASLREP
jgi:hypothetical protein